MNRNKGFINLYKIRDKILIGSVRKKVFFLLICFFILFIVIVYNLKFENIKTIGRKDLDILKNGNYEEFNNAIIKYNKQEVSLIKRNSKVKWEESYNLTNPEIEIGNLYFAIYDKIGNQVYIFNKDGMVLSYSTKYPISRLEIADNGYTTVLVNENNEYKIENYNTRAKLLSQININPEETGYPIDIALSSDAKKLLVSYIDTYKSVNSKIIGYDLYKEDKDIIFEHKISDGIATKLDTISKRDFVIYATNKMLFIRDSGSIEISKEIKLNSNIKSVKSIKNGAIIVTSSNEYKNEVNIYSSKGRLIKNIGINSDYSFLDMSRGNILLYNENRLSILSKRGRIIYEGNLNDIPVKIFKSEGIYRYLIFKNDEIVEVKLDI